MCTPVAWLNATGQLWPMPWAKQGSLQSSRAPRRKQRFTTNVQRVGLIKPEEGRKFLSDCRFLVQAILDNEQPSGPLLVLDAFSAGKPVVASDVNGTRDYVEHDVNGVLVPPGDPSSLAEAMSALFGDVERVVRMGEAARRTASFLSASRFWREVLEPYLSAYGA